MKAVQKISLLAILSLALTLIFVPGEAAPAPRKKSPEPKGSVKEGQLVFQHNCAMCHNADKTTAKIGPGLQGLFKNKELPASHRPATEENVREQIEKGSPNAKPMPMPAFAGKLDAKQMSSLIEYLKTL